MLNILGVVSSTGHPEILCSRNHFETTYDDCVMATRYWKGEMFSRLIFFLFFNAITFQIDLYLVQCYDVSFFLFSIKKYDWFNRSKLANSPNMVDTEAQRNLTYWILPWRWWSVCSGITLTEENLFSLSADVFLSQHFWYCQ